MIYLTSKLLGLIFRKHTASAWVSGVQGRRRRCVCVWGGEMVSDVILMTSHWSVFLSLVSSRLHVRSQWNGGKTNATESQCQT